MLDTRLRGYDVYDFYQILIALLSFPRRACPSEGRGGIQKMGKFDFLRNHQTLAMFHTRNDLTTMTPDINETRLDDLSLTRTGNDSVRISWKIRGKTVEIAIFSRQSADEIKHHFTAAGVKENISTNISGLVPDTRYYFEVVSDSGSKTTISERRVSLEGSVNFRDLGGYETVDGRRVKWGLVFRSDNLGRLTDRDVTFLQRMGIRLVCDFRTPAEAEKLPDRFPGDGPAKYLHLPIRHGEFDPANTFERIQKGDIEWMTEELRQTYGSAAGYLRKKAGIEQKVIDQLKKDLLE